MSLNDNTLLYLLFKLSYLILVLLELYCVIELDLLRELVVILIAFLQIFMHLSQFLLLLDYRVI